MSISSSLFFLLFLSLVCYFPFVLITKHEARKKKKKKILNELVSFSFLNNFVNCIIVTVLKRARMHACTRTHRHQNTERASESFFPSSFCFSS